MNNLEADVFSARRLFLNLFIFNILLETVANDSEEGFHLVRRALRKQLHAPVAQIANPACDSKLSCDPGSGGTKTDALDSSLVINQACDGFRHGLAPYAGANPGLARGRPGQTSEDRISFDT